MQQTHIVIDSMPQGDRWGNAPEWASVAVALVFGAATIVIIVRQVAVMRQQNLLIRWQHEHEWIRQNNADRARVLELTKGLHIAVGMLQEKSPNTNGSAWARIQDTALELSRCLSLLDEPPQSNGQKDDWFILLVTYVDHILKAAAEDQAFHKTYTIDDDLPTLSTIRAVKLADVEAKPVEIISQIGITISSRFLAFKGKWDSQFPA